MRSYLVRHAKAGQRDRWEGADAERPLSIAGRAQAEAIAERLVGIASGVLVSSPFVRCVQTLQPLAARLDADVVTDARLGEGATISDALAVLAEAGDGAVLCSHGDVIPDVVGALVRRGLQLTTRPLWKKGVIWTLDGDGDGYVEAGAERPV